MTNTTVNSGRTASNLDITNGNFLDVLAGGTANNTTIENGGGVAVEATSGGLGGIFGPRNGGVANNTTVHNGGILDLKGSNSTASNVVLDGGNLEVDTTASVTGSLTFGPTTGTQSAVVTLVANDGNFKPTMTGFSASSAIDDNAVQFSGAKLTTTVTNGNTIASLSGGGVTNTFTFTGTPHLMIVPDNGDDSGPEAVIVTTNTTLSFASPPTDVAQASQPSQAMMSFLPQPQGTAPAGGNRFGLGTSDAAHAQAATGATTGARTLISIAHEMTLPQNQDLGRAISGVVSQPHHHGMQSAVAGFLSNPAAAAIGGGGALMGALQHAAAAAVTPAPLHIG